MSPSGTGVSLSPRATVMAFTSLVAEAVASYEVSVGSGHCSDVLPHYNRAV